MATDALVERILNTVDNPSELLDAVRNHSPGAVPELPMASLGIADAGRCLGLSAHTLRYYEQQGLIRPSRNSSGYREYGQQDLRRLVFLTRMRLSGMTIQDLRQYIDLAERGGETIPERRRLMFAQRERILRQIRELTLALETTEYKIRSYDGHPEESDVRD